MDDNTTKVITAALGGSGAIAWLLKFLSTKKSAKLNDLIVSNGSLKESIELNTQISNKILSILELKFRSSIAESSHEILEIKQLAWYAQETEFYFAVRKIIIAGEIHKKEVIIIKIKIAITECIQHTDSKLEGFNISGYLASTQKKIEFVCNGPFPETIYKIIVDNRNDCVNLEANIRSISKQMLQSVKSKFYDDKNRTKEL